LKSIPYVVPLPTLPPIPSNIAMVSTPMPINLTHIPNLEEYALVKSRRLGLLTEPRCVGESP
ncbi:hypothetical protein KI387_008274, partial [Taxus chinensis]